MPISSLLAEITGEKPAQPSAASKPQLPSKRKADDSLRGPVSKIQRTLPNTGSAAPVAAPRAAASIVSDDAPSKSRGTDLASGPKRRPNDAASKEFSRNRPPPPVPGNRKAVAGRSRPGAAGEPVAVLPTPIKATPKYGSFLEILARGAAAQKSMGQVGKIQHKPIDKGPSKREREELKVELARVTKDSAGDRGRPSGATAAAQRGAPNVTLARRDSDRQPNNARRIARCVTGDGTPAQNARPRLSGQQQAVAEARKPKKAAAATTGYRGTARPPPGTMARLGAKGGSSVTEGAGSGGRTLGYNRNLPFGTSRNRKARDVDDDEMDDFIDYDEDDNDDTGVGRQYSYASEDDESDMEAGLFDIDQEERRAEAVGRLEDQQQEALERKLKREKEERKRRFVETSRR